MEKKNTDLLASTSQLKRFHDSLDYIKEEVNSMASFKQYIVSKFIGKKLTFPRDNKIDFQQDHRAHGGIPFNVIFEIVGWDDKYYKLIGHGYGMHNIPGSIIHTEENMYGNGCIYVKERDVINEILK